MLEILIGSMVVKYIARKMAKHNDMKYMDQNTCVTVQIKEKVKVEDESKTIA